MMSENKNRQSLIKPRSFTYLSPVERDEQTVEVAFADRSDLLEHLIDALRARKWPRDSCRET